MLTDLAKDITAFGGLPIYLASTGIMYFINLSLALRMFIALAVCYVVTILIRVIWFRERPKKKEFNNFAEKIDASSFPSLHSMRATVLALFLSQQFIHPMQQAVLAACWLAACYTRIHLEKHHPSDVFAGVAFGVLISLL